MLNRSDVFEFRKHGRYMSNKGYVDSTRRIRSLHRQQDDLHISPHHLSPSRGGLLAAINKSSLSSSAPPIPSSTPRKLRSSSDNDLTSISANLENKKREYEKQMRLIEVRSIDWIELMLMRDALFFRNKWSKPNRVNAKLNVSKVMWRKNSDWSGIHSEIWMSVSEESWRMDIWLRLGGILFYCFKTRLRNVTVLTEIYRRIFKRKITSNKNTSKNERRYDSLDHSMHSFSEISFLQQTKQRTDRLVDSLQSNKDKDRRNLLLCNDLARQYRNKANELDVKHLQLGRIHSDFEQKVQKREVCLRGWIDCCSSIFLLGNLAGRESNQERIERHRLGIEFRSSKGEERYEWLLNVSLSCTSR